MNEKDVFKYLKDLGCCNGCCLRYLGLKSPNVYENTKEFALKFQDDQPHGDAESKTHSDSNTATDLSNSKEASLDTKEVQDNGTSCHEGDVDQEDAPPYKRRKWEVCASCIGVLQEETWPDNILQVKEVLDKKQYECPTFACALSAPIATLLREKAITLMLAEKFPEYDPKKLPTALKEAWKWSFGSRLASEIGKSLDSGAVSPLLVTLNMEYQQDVEELESLKHISPEFFSTRSKQRRRFTVEFTRRSVEQALEGVSLEALRVNAAALPVAAAPVRCISVACTHAPLYLGGRYIKLSRSLPQTPWVLRGVRMMDSSVQEVIAGPIGQLYEFPVEDLEHRLKFVSAGREDVDVRCLGQGRPFAIEVSDPSRAPSPEELKRVCEQISADGRVIVNKLCIVSKEELTQLKLGEETKCKTYEALCIKLTHSSGDQVSGENGESPVSVTQADIDKINSFTNIPATESSESRVRLSQRTPIRVLHRRPLLVRERCIHELTASTVSGHPSLFVVRVRTEAGTYIKEWAHGECGRTEPALGAALGARVDILALDVATVHLDWPISV